MHACSTEALSYRDQRTLSRSCVQQGGADPAALSVHMHVASLWRANASGVASLAKPRDLPGVAGKVANMRRARKRAYVCFVVFGLLLESILLFLLFESPTK